MTEKKIPFECWAVVELMGHHQIAGRVTEESIAGTNSRNRKTVNPAITPTVHA